MSIIDTGVLLAAADDNDLAHQACCDAIETTTVAMITTPLVVAETGYLIDRQLGPACEAAFNRSIVHRYVIVEYLTATGVGVLDPALVPGGPAS